MVARAGCLPDPDEVLMLSVSLGRLCPHQFDEIPHRTVRLAGRLTFRRVVSSYR